jgi:hypothetical protein
MHTIPEQKLLPDANRRLLRGALLLVGLGLVFAASAAATLHPQEPQGEIIGTIEGQAIAVKGPMSVQVVGNEVKTLLRSGVDVRVKTGRARIDLVEGGTISVCGPAHISMLKTANALTVALDSGTIHARVDGNLALNVFTAQILAKSVAIGDGPQDILVGFDAPGQMCIRAARGAIRLEEQFGGQSVMVPQGGDVILANGQINAMRSSSGQCACEGFEPKVLASSPNVPELSTLASSEEVKKAAPPRNPVTQSAPAPVSAVPLKAPAFEPTYQVIMPPLRYDASAKVQDEPDPKLIVLVRRVRVRPTLIFESKVEGEPVLVVPKVNSSTDVKAAQNSAPKPAAAASDSVVDRVKTFFKSLWAPNS